MQVRRGRPPAIVSKGGRVASCFVANSGCDGGYGNGCKCNGYGFSCICGCSCRCGGYSGHDGCGCGVIIVVVAVVVVVVVCSYDVVAVVGFVWGGWLWL